MGSRKHTFYYVMQCNPIKRMWGSYVRCQDDVAVSDPDLNREGYGAGEGGVHDKVVVVVL